MFRSAMLLVVVAGLGGIAPAVASAYWDYTGWLRPGFSYGESNPDVGCCWAIRQNRSNCNAKMETRYRGTSTWTIMPYLNGCADTDGVYAYNSSGFDASHGINQGGSDVWVNIRIDNNNNM